MFFGLNYPEIRRNTVYIPTNCTILSTSVVPYRYCSKSCTYCSSYYGRSCNGVSALDQQLDKYDLSSATEQQIEGPCDNGYRCCHEHCDTCRSCSSSCRRLSSQENEGGDLSKSPNLEAEKEEYKPYVRALLSRRITHTEVRRRLQKKSCHTTCHSYSCHCYCVSSTNSLQCSYTCVPHFESHVVVSFPWRADGASPTSSDSPVQTTVVSDYGDDASRAQLYLNEHFHDSSHDGGGEENLPCYYDPDWNPVDVSNRYDQITAQQLAFEWELGYEVWKWILFAVPAFSILVLLVAVSYFLLHMICPTTGVFAGISSHKLLLSLWCGFLLPLGFFLPLQAGKINDQGKEILHWLTFIFVGVFNIPSLFDLTKRRLGDYRRSSSSLSSSSWYRLSWDVTAHERSSSHDSLHAVFSVLMGWLLPLSIVCPYLLSYWWLPSTEHLPVVTLSLSCFFFPFLFFLILYPWMIQQWRLHVVVHGRSGGSGGSGGSGAMQTGVVSLLDSGTKYDSVVDENMQDWAAVINSHVVPTPFGEGGGDGSVPLAPTPSAPPNFDVMRVEQEISYIATVKTTKELLSLLERLTIFNTRGQISTEQRGLLIIQVKRRRDVDVFFCDQLWTYEVSKAYGSLLTS